MKEVYADPVIGMVGLLLFLFLFMGILAWLFWPGTKEKFKRHGEIPLKDGYDE